jgi:hypothetical protein
LGIHVFVYVLCVSILLKNLGSEKIELLLLCSYLAGRYLIIHPQSVPEHL